MRTGRLEFRSSGILLVLITFIGSTSGWPSSAATREEFATPGGPLVIEQLDDQPLGREFAVRLAGQAVLYAKEGADGTAFPDFPQPKIVTYVGEPIGLFDAVVVFQQFSYGNACNGGPVWFLGVRRDGSYARSAPIDACGGAPPRVTVDRGVIHLTLQQNGLSSLVEEWIYSGARQERIREGQFAIQSLAGTPAIWADSRGGRYSINRPPVGQIRSLARAPEERPVRAGTPRAALPPQFPRPPRSAASARTTLSQWF